MSASTALVSSPPRTAGGAVGAKGAAVAAAGSSMPAAPSAANALARTFYRRVLPGTCIAFASDEGRAIFREAMSTGGMECYFNLAEQCASRRPFSPPQGRCIGQGFSSASC